MTEGEVEILQVDKYCVLVMSFWFGFTKPNPILRPATVDSSRYNRPVYRQRCGAHIFSVSTKLFKVCFVSCRAVSDVEKGRESSPGYVNILITLPSGYVANEGTSTLMHVWKTRLSWK